MSSGGGFCGNAGFPTDQAAVLNAVVERIQGSIASLADDVACFVSLVPDPDLEERQPIYCTVCPMPGEFDQQIYDGAGIQGVVEMTGVLVTVFSNLGLDRPDEHTALLLDPSRGLITLKQQLLKTMLANPMLQDANGNNILIEPMLPQQSSSTGRNSSREMGRFSLRFSTSFRWNLQ